MLPDDNSRRAISTSAVNTVCAQADIEFTFVHVCMGQGDCTLIKCPDGEVIIVDAGSSRANTLLEDIPFVEACALLRSDKWCGARGNKVKALIATHSDMDHINKISALFLEQSLDYKPSITDPKTGELTHKAKEWKGEIKAITVETCYKPLIESSTTNLKRLEIVKTVQKDNYDKHLINVKIINCVDITTPPTPNNPVIVAEGNGWRVEIITGAVPLEKKDKSNDLNACSIMTLCRIWRQRPGATEINEKRALFCGDATYSTENFACANWKDHISNLNHLMVPHHGSENGSSEPFIQLTNPKRIIVSVNDLDRKYQHPRYNGVLEKYRERVRERSEEHEFGYWYIETEKEIEVDGINYNIKLEDFYNWLYGVNQPTGDPWAKLDKKLERDKLEFATVGSNKNACVVLGDDNDTIANIFDIEAISQSLDSKTKKTTHLIWYVEKGQLNLHTTGTGSKLFKMNTKRLQEFEMPILELDNGEIKIATEGTLKSLPPKNPSLNTFTNTPIGTPMNTSPGTGTSGQKRPREEHKESTSTSNKRTKT